jgi:hypothetical protein
MAAIMKDFPHTRYHAEARLVTWHPRGMLDDELADKVVAFVEAEESLADAPFHRFTDFSGLTEVHLKIGHTFRIAEQRRADYAGRDRVKSAFFSDRIISFGIARLYEELMAGSAVEVRAFRTREAAAEWLGVPVEILLPDAIPL